MRPGSQLILKRLKFGSGHDQIPDFSFEVALGFLGQIMQMEIVNISNKKKINNSSVSSNGIVIKKIGFFNIAKPRDNAFDHTVYAHHFLGHGDEFRKQGMVLVGAVQNLSAAFLGCNQVALGQMVEF